MPRRRLRLGALVVVAVLGAVLVPMATAGTDRPPLRADAPVEAFAAGLGPLDVPAVRLTGDDRRASEAAARGMKHRLVLLALVAALAAMPVLRRRPLAAVPLGRPRLAWWSPCTGRAPPALQLLVV